ncbi:hypothetical protein AL387_gp133 [Salmon gill poxvirus]|uniref:Uncharacterized protein n=1 Tax=Salmon gill poxvirus TaxID=1680908 RepID=A0A0H4Y1G7_9POXV|nr:hypothetical protein AL387_gp133 [Salmon gill poxvirus]AKR04257.1 hypothetical protein SGPV133 [Salmon gill poxvirus]WMX26539.1 hypothetical protein [Salmon gill poxvirus]
MENITSGLIANIWKTIKYSCDMTLAETKLYYKYSKTPTYYNIVTKADNVKLPCSKDEKTFKITLDKIVSPAEHPEVRFCLNQVWNITTGVSNVYSLRKGVNSIGTVFQLNKKIWNETEDAIVISWKSFTDPATTLTDLEYVFILEESGV